MMDASFGARTGNFIFSSVFRPAVGRALYPVLWEQRILPSGKSGRSAKVSDYIYVCPSLNALNYVSAKQSGETALTFCCLKEETFLQCMIVRLSETGRCCAMEMNVEKTKGMGISRERSPLQIMVDQKQLVNVNISTVLVA